MQVEAEAHVSLLCSVGTAGQSRADWLGGKRGAGGGTADDVVRPRPFVFHPASDKRMLDAADKLPPFIQTTNAYAAVEYVTTVRVQKRSYADLAHLHPLHLDTRMHQTHA